MSTKTGIEWTDATWNPIRGCSRVSEGCRHCYAEATANHVNPDEEGGQRMMRVGKKAAGHLLDGVEWHQFPEVASR